MKICVVAGDAVGGLRKHVHDTLFALDSDIKAVYVHSCVSDAAAIRDFAGLDRFLLGRFAFPIKKNPAVSDLKIIWAIFKECRRLQVDLIHGHGAKGGLYARIVGLLLWIPVVVTPHGGSVHARFGLLKQKMFGSVEFLLKFITTLFIFESVYTKTAFIKMAGAIPSSKSLVNFNGIKVSEFVPSGSWRAPLGTPIRLLTIGNLNKVKGQSVVLEALAILMKNNRNVLLEMCGSGEDAEYLAQLAHTLGVSSLVEFHGDVSDVRAYFKNANVVVIPSYFESFGYVGVEAGLMARPVVASATGGLKEVVLDGETGVLFAPGDAAGLAGAVELLIDQPEWGDHLVANARIRCVEQFDLARMTASVFSAYRKILGCDTPG